MVHRRSFQLVLGLVVEAGIGDKLVAGDIELRLVIPALELEGMGVIGIGVDGGEGADGCFCRQVLGQFQVVEGEAGWRFVHVSHGHGDQLLVGGGTVEIVEPYHCTLVLPGGLVVKRTKAQGVFPG